jgi:hypothetical protein
VDRARLTEVFERLDSLLAEDTTLHIRGGAAVLALGLEGRATLDVDVLPSSRFVDSDLRRACTGAGLLYNPPDKDFVEADYVEVVPEESLVLPMPSPSRPYNTVFRGKRLTVQTPPAADLVIGKLKRLDPEDSADIAFLTARFGLSEGDLREAWDRLPERFRRDPVLVDNLRWVIEDL